MKLGDQVTKKVTNRLNEVSILFNQMVQVNPLKCSIHNLKHTNNVGGKKSVTFQVNPCKIFSLKCDKFSFELGKKPGISIRKKVSVNCPSKGVKI